MICRGCGWLVEGEICPKCARAVREREQRSDMGTKLAVVQADDTPRQVKVYDSLFTRLTPWVLGVFLPLALLLTVLSVYVVHLDYSPRQEADDIGRIRYEAAIKGVWRDADAGAQVCFGGDHTGHIEINGEKKPFIYVLINDKMYVYSDAKMTVYSFRLMRGKLMLSNGQQEYRLRRVDGGVSS